VITPTAGHPNAGRHQPAAARRQCQLKTVCVPFIALKGDSYRLKDRDLGRVPGPAAEE
jgi:hypothetical protein